MASLRNSVSTDSRKSNPPALLWLASLCILLLLSALLLSAASEERRISIYSAVANYSLPVTQRNGMDYVGLLEILEPLGTVSAKQNGQRWKFRYEDVDCEFTADKRSAKIRGSDFDLAGDFFLENGRGLVPLPSLNTLLSRVLGGPVTLNQTARRVFIGNVAIHFTAQVIKNGPEKLVMNFSSPVNPTIATEPGRLRMVFSHEPLVAPGAQILTFDSKTIPSAAFQESNGVAEVVVNSATSIMASFSNDGRTITVTPTIVAAAQAAPPQLPPGPNPLSALLASTSAPVPGTRHYFAVVDASHGGDERGAALSPNLVEKDVTLAFARRLRQELETRGLPTMLVRDGDSTLTLDQRASAVNAAVAAIYIGIHVTSQGRGVRLYTALAQPGEQNQGPFVNWNTAQNPFLSGSETAVDAIEAELKNKEIAVRTLAVTLRPLNNVATAALAIELAPAGSDVSQVNASVYQQLVSGAVAAGIADVRGKLQATK